MPRYQIKISGTVQNLVKDMSIEDCLRQISCPHYFPHDSTYQEAGAAFFHPGEKESMISQINKYKSICKIPPLITTDMENGPGDMINGSTAFPMFMGCTLKENEKYIEDIGRCAALEGGEVGFNSTLGPCVDIFDLHDSPAVGLRSAGDQVDDVIRRTSSYVKGLQDHGMAATIKHFPGDGGCKYDQHLTTPESPYTWEQWQAGPGKVYQTLIDDGAQWVMPGHISLPCYDDLDPETDMYPPATLSKKLMTDLLKNSLNFDGLIISDAVEMGGFAGYMNIYDAMVRFLESGGDILLFPKLDETFFKEMNLRLGKALSETTLRNRAMRVVAFKEQQGMLSSSNAQINVSVSEKDKNEFQALAQQVTQNAIVIKRNRKKTLPISTQQTKRIAHLILEVSNGNQLDKLQQFTAKLQNKFENVVEWMDMGANQIFQKVQNKEVDMVICSISAPYRFGTNVTRFHGVVARNLMKGWMKLDTPVVFISHDSATFAEEYRQFDTIISTHGLTDTSIEELIPIITK